MPDNLHPNLHPYFHLTGACTILVVFISVFTNHAFAHVSEQGLVLLLPTDIYISSGVLVVLLTLVLVLALPASWSLGIFKTWFITKIGITTDKWRHSSALANVLSWLSLLTFCLLVALGFAGTFDPLENLLPLVIWTVWWIGFPVLQGFIGDWWRWINPWTGLFNLIKRTGWTPPFKLPAIAGQWPGVLLFLLFIAYALADPAPDDPRRLAVIALGYWCFTMACLMLFGERWLTTGECFSMLLHRFSQLSLVGVVKGSVKFGVPGWKMLANQTGSVSSAVFVLVLLGCGSFDGLNETFAWLALINVNPLEFPGRSAVVTETVVGLLCANLLLVTIYAMCVFLGTVLANRSLSQTQQVTFKTAFCALAISVLPIAFVYHFAHYLTAFLINVQYVIAAASDPLSNGSDLLNLGSFYVTTGFMNTPDSVKAIWLTQAGAVVLGHVLSVLLAHAVAVQLFGNARRAIVSQAPLAVFMVVYTFIGLWLLAAPKGA